jgi:hypothetical protein
MSMFRPLSVQAKAKTGVAFFDIWDLPNVKKSAKVLDVLALEFLTVFKWSIATACRLPFRTTIETGLGPTVLYKKGGVYSTPRLPSPPVGLSPTTNHTTRLP